MSFGYQRPPYGYAPRFRPQMPMQMGPRGPYGPRGPNWNMNRPPMAPMFNYNDGEPPFGHNTPEDEPPVQMHLVSPENVKDWLSHQHPNTIRDVMMYSRWLLDKMGFPMEHHRQNGPNPFAEDEIEDSPDTTWYSPFRPNNGQHGQPPSKKSKPGLGFSNNAPSTAPKGPIQWTPEGWAPKDNSHKVTTVMKPLPKIELVPPFSATYPDASADRDKLRMLENNVSMMSVELMKICKRFNISNLNKEDLSSYTEEQRDKLKTAITCVSNAEKTLSNYKDFLKSEKYKEWNEEQEKSRESAVKSMIGDTPDGIPHKRPAKEETEEAEPASA